MKLVDILFLLTVAATVNAILVPADNDRSTHASSTSSQVSGPTDEPSPAISDEYQEEPMDLSLPGRIRQRPMDQPNSNIPSQTHRPTVIAAGSSTSKRGQKRPIDVIDLITFDQDQQPVDVAGPSTPKQSQQQSVSKGKSSNTVLNQVAGLKERYQKTFHRINQKLVESKEIRKKKQQEYRECSALRFEHELALVMGKDISGSKYSPEDEVKLKYEYEQAIRRVVTIKQDLKRFMKRHGLKFEELKLD